MTLADRIPATWQATLTHAVASDSFASLEEFVAARRLETVVWPREDSMFRALDDVAPEAVRAVIVGQDPYPAPGRATGRAFAVTKDTPVPVSLRRILDAAGLDPGDHSDLANWAASRVLLLNRCLTVDEDSPGSHRRRGWEAFTSAIVKVLDSQPHPIVFLLWGKDAREVALDIRSDRNIIWQAPHPAARRGGFRAGFRETNDALRARGMDPIPWGPLA